MSLNFNETYTDVPISQRMTNFLLNRGFIEPHDDFYVETPGTVQIYCNCGDHWLDTSLCELMSEKLYYLPDEQCQINHILGMDPSKVKSLILEGRIRKLPAGVTE